MKEFVGILLAAGRSVTLADPDKPAIQVEVTNRDNTAVNLGTLIAKNVTLYGGIIKNSGLIQATTAVAVVGFPCGAGTSHTCNGCVPTTCAAQGLTSGSIADGCGGTLFCGAATLPRIAGTASSTCAIENDGSVKCWGLNGNGQLGDGTTTQRTTPVLVSGLTSAIALAGGDNFMCALIQGGTIKCWGYNGYGQLGDTTTAQKTTPVAVSGITTAVSIAAGQFHTCARLADGTVKCWGRNTWGQLGDNTVTQRSTPVTVLGIGGVSGISAGATSTCALLANGEAMCWGDNTSGQLGNGNTASLVPVSTAGITSGLEVAVGTDNDYGCALLSNGTAKCWGLNTNGQLGDNTVTTRTVPVVVSGLANAVDIGAYAVHSCAVLADGSSKCWGDNTSGEIGDGTNTNRLVPTSVVGISTAVTVAPGYRHTCAMLADNSVKCWGEGDSGQLGDGLQRQSGAVVITSTAGTMPSVTMSDPSSGSTTASSSVPMRQVPTGW